MINASQTPKAGRQFFIMALCIVALAGFFLPVINVHLSFLEEEHTSGISLITALDRSESLLDRLDLSGQFDMDETEFLQTLDEIHFVDIMEDAVRAVTFSASSYIVVLILLFAVFVLAFMGKFALLKIVMLAISLVLLIIAGAVIVTVPELAVDILHDIMEETVEIFAAFMDISEIIQVKIGVGYWITLCPIAVMLLTETLKYFQKKNDEAS